MDLANALNITPQAIGLNGRLGIAFGARGSGNALAHYEPSETVINLTKTKGAGSLAHEWWHALDHYMSGENNFLSITQQTYPQASKALAKSMRTLMIAVEDTALYTRSKQADQYRTNYFATNEEISARVFEAYIKHCLQEKGIKNDFLVNIKSVDQWQKSLSTYPYPNTDEIQHLSPYYTHLFDTLKTIDKTFIAKTYAPESIIHVDTLTEKQATITAEYRQEAPSAQKTVNQSSVTTKTATQKDEIANILEKNATNALQLYEKDINRFHASIDKVVSGIYGRGYIPIGKTPDVLKILNIPDTQVRIKEQHLEKVMATYLGIDEHKYSTPHNLTPETLRKIPSEIHNPIAVFQSSTRENSYLVLTEQYEYKLETGKNAPIAVIFNVNSGKKEIDIINIGSIYGRSQNQLIRDFTENLLYLNTEKGQKFLNTERLQLPWDFTSENSNLECHYKTEKDLSQYILSKTVEKPTKREPSLAPPAQDTITAEYRQEAPSAQKTETGYDLFVVPADIQEKFNQEVERLSNSIKSHPEPIITKTPPIFLYLDKEKGITVNDLEMVLDKNTIDKIQGKHKDKQDDAHRLTKDDIKNLLTNLYDPVAVFKTRNSDGIVAITEIQDMNQNPVIAIVHLNKQYKRRAVNDIASMYGKDNQFEYWLSKNIGNNNLLYLNHEKSPNLVRLLQHQLSEMVHQVGNEANILTPKDIVNKYHQKDEAEQPTTPPPNKTAKREPPLAPPAQATLTAFLSTFGQRYHDENVLIANIRATQPFYLAVPYQEKDIAKTAGARWDNDKHCWYAPTPDIAQALSTYHPDQRLPALSTGRKTLNDFIQSTQAIGLDMHPFRETYHEFIRIPLTDRGAHNKDGVYKLFQNPDGTIGALARNLATGEALNYSTTR